MGREQFQEQSLAHVDSQRWGNRESSKAGHELLGRGEPRGQR